MPTRKFTDYAKSGLIPEMYIGGVDPGNKVLTAESANTIIAENYVSTNTNTAFNVTSYFGDNEQTGAVVFQAPYAHLNYMHIMRFSFYGYTTDQVASIIIGFYTYAATDSFLSIAGYVTGELQFSTIRLAENASGNICVVFGNSTEVRSYDKFILESVAITHGEPVAGFENWTASLVSDLSSYSNFTSVPHKQILDSSYLSGNTVVTGNWVFGNTTDNSNTTIDILADDLYTAQLRLMGSSQGTGKIFVGQSADYGGGILYNGDDNPNIPQTSDNISFYRRTVGVETEVFSYSHGNSIVYFRDSIVITNSAFATGYGRTTHQGGSLVGGYNNIAANNAKSNPIYTIGTSYIPSDAALGNMYGIGYCNSTATFINSTDLGATPYTGWGMYVASDGNARIWLGGASGNANFKGTIDTGALVSRGTISASNISDVAGNSTIVKRSSSGYIRCNYINTTAGSTTTMPTNFWVETGTDHYHRKQTVANVRANLAAGYQTIYVPAGAMYARATNGATFNQTEINTSVTEGTMDFSTSTQQYCSFSIKMPKSWNEGVVSVSFAWSHKTTTGTAGVVLGFRAIALPNSGTLTSGYGSNYTRGDTGGTGNDIYFADYMNVTVGGTPAADEYVRFDIYRYVSYSTDNLAQDLRLHGVTVRYTTNTMIDN